MAKNTINLNGSRFKKDLKKSERWIKYNLSRKALREMKKNTPIDSGNARRKTRKELDFDGFELIADYKYSGVIDRGLYPSPPKKGTGKTRSGYSTQAPEGLIKPTMEYIRKQIDRFLRRL